MKVLCLLDIDEYRNKNNFPIDFVRSFEGMGEEVTIDYGIQWLSEERSKWDIIHIHWPENLTKGRFLNNKFIEWLDAKLKVWAVDSQIVATIHNLGSHYGHSSLIDFLYYTVFKNCHGFIHLGRYSVNAFAKSYGEALASKPISIIPHGNYSSLFRNLAKSVAEANRITTPKKKILVVGRLRDIEELHLLWDVSKKIDINAYEVVFAGRLPSARLSLKQGKLFAFFNTTVNNVYWRAKLAISPVIIADFGFISDEKLVKYLSATNVLFIPRKMILNSGNLPLGFSFGKVVVGPNVGNVGELLKQYHNPVFEPSASGGEIHDILMDAVKLDKDGLGEKNKIIALRNWDWNAIAKMHIDFYRNMLQ
jgi:hypothetical protein